MAKLAVVIPVYQAEQTLDALVAELVPALSAVTADYEIWMVEDGSTDASWAGVGRLAAANPRVRGLRLIRNFGEHVALTAGLDRVNADYVVIMACDLQDDPAAIARMIDEARRGADLVLVRRLKRQDAWLKRQLARAFYAVISLLFHIDYDYRVGNFRLLTRRGVEYFRLHRERMRNVNAIMALMGLRTAFVDVTHRPRRHGRSTYTLARSARMAASVIVGYSDIPLLVSGAFGGVLLVGALLWGLWLTARTSSDASISETALLAATVFGIGGLILVNLGIVGAYLGRAAREAKERPMYFVSETAGLRSPTAEDARVETR
ncbi:MAG TPA: glycosyltransferase family 2 protein [Vicinamibacterales bacterium]|nr:glycosyltransferase family 2 protein [Vicinamibacterales bacterium]